MSLSAADHRTAAIMLSESIPGFEPNGLADWLARAEYKPHTNIGPGQSHWMVRGREGRAILDRGTWGYTAADKPGKLIFNARAETLAERPMFRGAFERRRCLIPRGWILRVGAKRSPALAVVVSPRRWPSAAVCRGVRSAAVLDRDGPSRRRDRPYSRSHARDPRIQRGLSLAVRSFAAFAAAPAARATHRVSRLHELQRHRPR